MALSNLSLLAAAAAAAADNTQAARTAAFVPALIDAVLQKLCTSDSITPQQGQHFAEMRAEAVANNAEFVTALTVAA